MKKYSTEWLANKNWKLYKKTLVVNGITFKLKDLATLPLHTRLEFHPELFVAVSEGKR